MSENSESTSSNNLIKINKTEKHGEYLRAKKRKNSEIDKMKWYTRVLKRQGVWQHLTSPLYILVVLFLSILLLPGIFLAVTWYPWVYHITNKDTVLSKLLILVVHDRVISNIFFSF